MKKETIARMSRAEIDRMLQSIEKSDAPPPEHNVVAMCYSSGSLPFDAYVCPKCGEKTSLANAGKYSFAANEIERCRRELAELKELSPLELTLDESSFCKKCRPDEKDPSLALRITYSDGSVSEVSDVDCEDLQLLTYFFRGEQIPDFVTVHKCEELERSWLEDRLSRLKKEALRLRRILGLEKKEAAK